MDRPIALAVAALLLVAGATVALTGGADPSDDDPRLAVLEQRIAALESEVAQLKQRRGRRGPPAARAEGERRGRGRAAGSMAPTTGGGAGVEARVVEALTEEDEVRGAVQDLVREEMETQRQERWERRRERIEERAAERIEQLAEDASLSDQQTEQLGELLADERDRFFNLFAEARQTMAWDEAREQSETIRSESDAAVAELLTGTQLEAFQAMREEEAARRGR
jgi:hypothetical protein